MNPSELSGLIETIESKRTLSPDEIAAAQGALKAAFPASEPIHEERPGVIGSSDMLVHLADTAFPGWSVHIDGRTSNLNGHWRCTFRKSDVRDNDELLGIGNAPVMSHAILTALLRLRMAAD